MVTSDEAKMREAPWSAVAAATAFFLPLREGHLMDQRRKAVAAATALQGAFGTETHAGGDPRATTAGIHIALKATES